MKSVMVFMHKQHAANGERSMKNSEAMNATGMAMNISTKNHITAHSQPRDDGLELEYVTYSVP